MPAEDVAPPVLAPQLTPPPTAVQRLVSLDAFRGLAMVLMASASLAIPKVAESIVKLNPPAYPGGPDSAYVAAWKFWAYETEHAQWVGCTLWDLIQPCFMFMVGAALPFSIASRVAKGQGFARMAFHAAWRAVALALLGVFLSSTGATRTNWAFMNVLSQIGLGYFFLFLLAWVKPKWQLTIGFAILFLYWLAFALYPATPAGFDYAGVNAKGWAYPLHDFAAHWDKNTNLGWRVDEWFLNLFPRQVPFTGNEGGYVTLNFVPALVTMLFGLLAGELLRSPTTWARKVGALVVAGGIGLGVGYVLDRAGICPMVKRIWTPGFALFSAGWACLGLAFFYLVCDVVRLRAWAFPLVIVGMNSIAVYLMSQLLKPFVRENFNRHFGDNVFGRLGERTGGAHYGPMIQAGTILLVFWLVTLWMFRRRIFLKI